MNPSWDITLPVCSTEEEEGPQESPFHFATSSIPSTRTLQGQAGSRVSACFLVDPCTCWAAVRGKHTHLAASPGQNCCLTCKVPLQADVCPQGDLPTWEAA